MAAKYQTTHEVAYYECDINQTMTFPAMLSVAIKASEEQSEQLDRGATVIGGYGLSWIITSYHILVTRLPKVGEQIQVVTQAKEYNKFFCYRYFWLLDDQGNELRIKRYPKIEPITEGRSLPYRVRFYDIDSNQHVNNAIYFNWLLDVLGHDFLTKHLVQEVTIRFDREVAYGNLIDSHVQINEALTLDTGEVRPLQTLHEIKIADVTYCEAVFTWQER